MTQGKITRPSSNSKCKGQATLQTNFGEDTPTQGCFRFTQMQGERKRSLMHFTVKLELQLQNKTRWEWQRNSLEWR